MFLSSGKCETVPSLKRGRAPERAADVELQCFPKRSSSSSLSPEDPTALAGTETGTKQANKQTHLVQGGAPSTPPYPVM